jgi:ABC-2 type transport system permease protein
MRTLKFLLRKEFLQIFRDKLILRMIFALPVIQLIILPYAATYEIKNITLSVVDHDHSEYSRKLINNFTASGYFQFVDYSKTYNDALDQVEKDKADLIVEIPEGFERDLIRENETKVLLAANAISGQTAGLAVAYANSIIKDFNNDVRTQWIQQPRLNAIPVIDITSSNWFNEQMDYKFFIVPGSIGAACYIGGISDVIIKYCKRKRDWNN